MHRTQKNDKAARCVSPSLYSIVKVQEPESRVHRKMQARVREGADENVPQGNASAAYFTADAVQISGSVNSNSNVITFYQVKN